MDPSKKRNGLLVLDKPAGMTSHDLVQVVRRKIKIRRVGHAGTLDPMATGVLLVAVGEGTRLVQFLMEGKKTYQATLKLGETTDTQDSEGEILQRMNVPVISIESIARAAQEFVGNIEQVPPMYSALKHNGVSLHKMARQGIVVERQARPVKIFRLDITHIDLPYISLEVDCSKGTYVRTLCHDLGLRLGPGAHLTSLRRTCSGGFSAQEALKPEDLDHFAPEGNKPLLTLLEAMKGYPLISLLPEAVARLQNGIPPSLDHVIGPAPEVDSTVALVKEDRLLAVASFEPHRQKESRGDFRLLCVFPEACVL